MAYLNESICMKESLDMIKRTGVHCFILDRSNRIILPSDIEQQGIFFEQETPTIILKIKNNTVIIYFGNNRIAFQSLKKILNDLGARIVDSKNFKLNKTTNLLNVYIPTFIDEQILQNINYYSKFGTSNKFLFL